MGKVFGLPKEELDVLAKQPEEIGFVYYFITIYSRERAGGQLVSADVKPGTTSATLTLSNGKKILLSGASNGELANQTGVTIKKTADGKLIYEITPSLPGTINKDETTISYNTLSTAKGETYQVKLPDGSLVFLNAASSLKYPTNFDKQKTRLVSLTGEGYFEISKDKSHPFIVKTTKQQVTVLGTHFNINSYTDEKATTTTLVEGSVRVSSPQLASNTPSKGTGIKNALNVITLIPGQQALMTRDNITVQTADIESVTAWKNGNIVFDNENLEGILRKIARWYNVDVIYNVNAPANLTMTGSISRFQPLSVVLEIIEKTNKVKFKIEGRRIMVN